MDEAWELGITTFDTADAYGGGRSETCIGDWLRTKGRLGPRRDRARDQDVQPDTRWAAIAGSRARRILRQIDISLRRLGVERVALYLRARLRFRRSTGGDARHARRARPGRQGRRGRRIQLPRGAPCRGGRDLGARGDDPLRVGPELLLAARSRGRGVGFPVCREHGLGYEAYGPLAGGWLTGKYRRGESYPEGSRMTQRPDSYSATRTTRSSTPSRRSNGKRSDAASRWPGLALAWLLASPEVTAVIVGPTRAEHLEPVREALSLELTSEERASSARLVPRERCSFLSEHDVAPAARHGVVHRGDGGGALGARARGALPAAPLRRRGRRTRANLIGLMPAHRAGDAPAWALKEIVVTPDNPTRGLDAHQGAVLLHDGVTGQLVAVLNASPVTEIRTAAVSAVATRALARADANASRSSAQAFRRGRTSTRCERSSTTPRSGSGPATWTPPSGSRAEVGAVVAPSADAALFGAEVVCTTTSSTEPIVEHRWLAPGAHVNAVGSSIPTTRELDTETVAESSLFVDRRESTLNEAGDYLIPAGRRRDRRRSHQGRARRGARRRPPRAGGRRRADASSSRSVSRSRISRRRSSSFVAHASKASAPRSSSDPARRHRGRARPDRDDRRSRRRSSACT